MTSARDRQDDYRTARRLNDLERAVRQIPSKFTRGGDDTVSVIVILNGNTIGSSVKGILYAASVTLTAAPDIDDNGDVANGLGRAYLYVNGNLSGRVWVRHDRLVDVLPLAAGDQRRAVSTVSIPHDTGAITAYRWEY